jgi:outer membrane protein assembly factor BamB
MNLTQACRFFPAVAATVGALLIVQWLGFTRASVAIDRRDPGPDRGSQASVATVDLNGSLVKGEGAAGKTGDPWPGFRGPNRDNINTEKLKLYRAPAGGTLPRLWQIDVGEGYAGASAVDGRVYILDYDEVGRGDVLRCLSSDDGREIWRRSYKVEVGRNHGITRTVCAVADGRVVSLGPKCHVLCADSADGSLKWSLDLVRDFGATVPPWYTGQNPLIDNGRVILAPGGNTALLVAVELSTGKAVWQTPNPNRWTMTHSSVTPVKFQDKKLYVYCASAGVVGVNAEDGRIEFEIPQWKVSMANVPSPLPLPEGRLLFTGGYGAGAMCVKLSGQGGKIIPEVVFRLPPEIFGAEQQTPIFYRGYIYGILPVSSQLCCLSLDGKQFWTSGAKNRFGLGPFLIADGMILALADNGTLNFIEATETEYKPLGKATLFDHGHEAWGPLALSGGKLFARDLTHLACFDLREVGHD